MSVCKPVSKWKQEVAGILESKVEELQLLDYSKATVDDVWNCIVDKVWKGNPEKRLHEVVQDIFHLHPNIYISYLAQQSWQDDNLQESIDALFGMEENSQKK
ncbi:post-transcriptional regulator [Gracilibacillus sp. YIM 98692]|uniref:post-transcriptional regulator n=1 Tax=Gracilibacillus sp. YIM 98692 TaxID=2663532 RepID=UPI0013D6C524|nr:post-transcriptional regulator [Gracilibacillus sp. YIM 98692]